MNGLLSMVGLALAATRLELIWEFSVVDFYNQINLLYGSITEFCSPRSCPEMKATDEYANGPKEHFPEAKTC